MLTKHVNCVLLHEKEFSLTLKINPYSGTNLYLNCLLKNTANIFFTMGQKYAKYLPLI